MENANEILEKNSYPGRGIIIGLDEKGENAVIVYFIMGRSENSRNRIFILDGDDVKTKAFEENRLKDPSLIIYMPVKVLDKKTIVTNGDQTQTIFDALQDGKGFEQALRTRTFEPDAPNFTPRISGIVEIFNKTAEYKLSIIKSLNQEGNSTQRFFYEYPEPTPGQGHFIHTYMRDQNPLPSFCGEPHLVKISGNIENFSDNIWKSMNDDNKISLFSRFINIKTGETKTRIINKNQQKGAEKS